MVVVSVSGEGEGEDTSAPPSSSWPSHQQLDAVRKKVAQMRQRNAGEGEVSVVASPYRICPLGAHIDHQGGVVTAMTINYGVLLAFVPSQDGQIVLQSGQFRGELKFNSKDSQTPITNPENICWESYARGAVYALQSSGYDLHKGIIGFISGVEGLDSSGLSSSAAVGIAYLLALEYANKIIIPPLDNINLDKLIENKYLGLENGILDQSAILLSRSGYLTFMDCKTKQPFYTRFGEYNTNMHLNGEEVGFKILLAFSGIRHNLPKKRGYNTRVAECKAAAHALFSMEGYENSEPLLCDVDASMYEAHKGELEEKLAKRAEHYFSETNRVAKGREAWARGNLEEFGKLITESGRSSVHNYECGSKEMIQLYEIMIKAPGVYGARFSGAGFRGCCLALVAANRADEAAQFVKIQYEKEQPHLVSHIPHHKRVLLCEPNGAARIIFPDI